MKITINHNYGGAVEHLEGEAEQVQAQLRNRFPWLEETRDFDPQAPSLQDDLARLSGTQAYDVEVEA